MIKRFLLLFAVLVFANPAFATVKIEAIEYGTNDVLMEGLIAYPVGLKTPVPGILIVHDWMGPGKFTKDKAIKLALEGYVVLAVDVYGKGVRPKNQEQAAKLAGKYKEDRALLRSHIRAAYDTLAGMPHVDPEKIMVMGYCFGGTTALELARSGVPLVGTVSFHGNLATPTPEDAKNINGRVLVLHGGDDPYVPASEVDAFKEEMRSGNVKYRFVAFPGAVHAFTNPDAGSDASKGAAYNAPADRESWAAFEEFLKEVF